VTNHTFPITKSGVGSLKFQQESPIKKLTYPTLTDQPHMQMIVQKKGLQDITKKQHKHYQTMKMIMILTLK